MILDKLGQVLHHKSTTGAELSKEELIQLQEWYDYQDKQEMEALLVTQKVTEVISLKAQIERALAQLLTLAEQIKQVAIENEKIRTENILLRTRLVQHLNQQRA